MPRLADVFAFLDRESVPALYLLLLRAWTAVGGDGDPSLRRLGLVVTLAALGVVWIAARRLGRDVPLLALAFFGAHGFALYTLAAVRSYGLGALWMALAVPATWALVSAPGRWTWLAAAAVFALATHTLYTNAVLVAALCLAAGIVAGMRREWRTVGLVGGAGVAAAVTMLPYAGAVTRSMVWRPLHETSFGASDLLVRWLTAFAGADARLAAVWLVVAAVGLVAGVTLLASRAGLAAHPRAAYAALAVVGMTVFHVGLMAVTRRLPSYWHFVALMAPVAIALDAIFVERVWLRWARLGVVVVALPMLVALAVERGDTRRTNLDLVAGHLTTEARAGDLIVVNPWAAAPTLTRYYRGAAPIVTLPPIDDLTMQRPDLLKERMAAAAPLAPLTSGDGDDAPRGASALAGRRPDGAAARAAGAHAPTGARRADGLGRSALPGRVGDADRRLPAGARAALAPDRPAGTAAGGRHGTAPVRSGGGLARIGASRWRPCRASASGACSGIA